jgi:hypothetical protein
MGHTGPQKQKLICPDFFGPFYYSQVLCGLACNINWCIALLKKFKKIKNFFFKFFEKFFKK